MLDPCSGTGAILDVVQDLQAYSRCLGMELDPDRAAVSRRADRFVTCCDSLEQVWLAADVILTNPPYSSALDFVRRGVQHTIKYGATAAYLLRLNWLASKERASFHREHPADVYVLSKRPSFTSKGTDACEYGWFVWGPGRGGRWYILGDE